MVSIVVDASVARSCGDSTAIHPLPIQCRDFLLVMQEHRHSVVMTKEIRAEWDKHQSRFALTWLRQMVAKKQFNVQPGSPALYPLRMSVGMKGERIDDCSRAAQRAAFEA
jgi:hypothetical protein